LERVLFRPKDLSNEKVPAVDVTRIEGPRSLQANDPEGLMHELVELFLKRAHESLQHARLDFEEPAPMVLARAAHFLKGSCAQFRAQRACKLCSRLDEAGLSGLADDTAVELPHNSSSSGSAQPSSRISKLYESAYC
jgi:HPt (histidine-containing phosphotransfer) domain-containing protein